MLEQGSLQRCPHGVPFGGGCSECAGIEKTRISSKSGIPKQGDQRTEGQETEKKHEKAKAFFDWLYSKLEGLSEKMRGDVYKHMNTSQEPSQKQILAARDREWEINRIRVGLSSNDTAARRFLTEYVQKGGLPDVDPYGFYGLYKFPRHRDAKTEEAEAALKEMLSSDTLQ